MLSGGRLAAQARYTAAVGAVIPIGGAADKIKIGYQSAVAFSFTPFQSPNRIRLEATIAELMDKVPASTARRITSVTANLVLASLTAPKVPAGYVIAGVGAYHQRVAGQGTDNVGFNVGAGVSFTFGAFGAFTEARLHYLIADARTKLFPITIGLVF